MVKAQARTCPRADVSKLIPGVRMVAIPTTLSAAEFTAFAGVTDVSRRAKEGYGHPQLAPRAVVLDPAMTFSTPPQLWFSTGMKAVDHAVEQLCNPVRSPYADALAEAGLKRLAQGLLATKESPGDLDARLECPSECGSPWRGPARAGASAPVTPSATPSAAPHWRWQQSALELLPAMSRVAVLSGVGSTSTMIAFSMSMR
jgi:hypothetical protein